MSGTTSDSEHERVAGLLARLTALYVAFGLPAGLFQTALPAVLRAEGVSLEAIGAAALVYLPFSLSFLWAPAVDRHQIGGWGRRRTWIAGTQALMIVALGALAVAEPSANLGWVLAAFALLYLGAATQDVAIDGYMVESLPARARGLGNGLQIAGMVIGMAVGGAGFLLIYARTSWFSSVAVMAAVSVLAVIPMLREAERPQPAAARDHRPSVRHFFEVPGGWQLLGATVVLTVARTLAGSMTRPFLVDAGVSLAMIGVIAGTLGTAASVAGALGTGGLVARFGARGSFLGLGVLQVVIPLLLGGSVSAGVHAPWMLGTLASLDGLAASSLSVILCSAAMQRIGLRQAATDFAIFQCALNLAATIAAAVSGVLAAWLGWSAYYYSAALMMLASLIVAQRLMPQEAQ